MCEQLCVCVCVCVCVCLCSLQLFASESLFFPGFFLGGLFLESTRLSGNRHRFFAFSGVYSMHDTTTRTSSASAALLFTPSSNPRSVTSSPRPPPYVSTLPSMRSYSFTRTHSPLPLTNLSTSIHFPFLRYPLLLLHLL